MSKYSCDWFKLPHEEWFSMDVECQPGAGWDFSVDTAERIMFHGTEWGSAHKMIVMSQGFVVGEERHSKGGKFYAGAWCVPTLGDALLRAQPHRYEVDGDASRWCTPVVLEMACAHLVRMGGRSSMHCRPGTPTLRHAGVRLVRMHVNVQLMVQYMLLETAPVRQALLQFDTTIRRCSCGTCGAVSGFQEQGNPEWLTWRKSRKHQSYTEWCYKRMSAAGPCLL